MKKSDKHFIRQLVFSLEDAARIMKDAYFKKDFVTFDKARKTLLILQDKISEELE